jgi:ribonuclease E
MSNKMLIDATHPEETRVVVLRGNRVEEFDFEAADRQQLRGNIYLAKVTRVEPSLQAAFVDYGGNRHGFLAFSEIHPDYYQIPYADRQALLQEQAREDEEEAAAEQAEDEQADSEAAPAQASGDREYGQSDGASASAAGGETESHPTEGRGRDAASPAQAEDASAPDEVSEPAAAAESQSEAPEQRTDGEDDAPSATRRSEPMEAEHDDTVESVGAEDALEEVPERRKPRPRQYKIQEVIKRRQVLLVQVVKEERGNKGAALTTYLSLAGRYSVLMPNTGRGGGISRKITNAVDRKRLKAIAGELDVPEGMGVILRTAGANRTKAEVKRDFEYLLRLWENVRELTLRSTAPKLVYEEGSLIKRSIRDLYSREIEGVTVAGDEAYREAKDFMRMLMPSHARNVQQYRDDTPIFARNGVEAQLDAMFSPQVTLRSGGYIVINQTEALVSIDVNSGRSTREHSIEDTALNTNLEAAEEIARQLRLRDLAGLIVIDFIDMEEKRNNRSVERKLKDCLRADRARIQVGRISHFGLLEMSRQRLRTGVLESSTVLCPHCRGTGQVRSISSLSLQMLRAIEDHLLRHGNYHLHVHTRPEVALYVLNQKRRHLTQLEARFGLSISITGETPDNGAGFLLERGAPVEDRPERSDRTAPIAMIEPPEAFEDVEPAEVEQEEESAEESAEERGNGRERGEGRDKRRRRRRRGGGEDRHERHHAGEVEEIQEDSDEGSEVEEIGAEAERSEADDEGGAEGRRRRRGRRGGRRRGGRRENGDADHGRGRREFSGDENASRFAGDESTQTEDSGALDAIPLTGHDGGQSETSSEAVEDSFAQAPESPALAAAADEQVAGIFGDAPVEDAANENVEAGGMASDGGMEAPRAGPAGDGHAEEIAALTEAVQRRAEPEAPAETAGEEPAMAETAASEPAQAPVEDNRPKRSGWWSRR